MEVVASVVWHYLSNATCLMRTRLFYVFVVRFQDHHMLLDDSPLLKKTCIRHVVLHKWFCLPQPRGSSRGRQGGPDKLPLNLSSRFGCSPLPSSPLKLIAPMAI